MTPSKARRRQLQKLAERRAAERRRHRRNRLIAIIVAFAVAAGGGTLAFFAFTGPDEGQPAAGPSASPSPIPVEEIACGGEKPAAAEVQKPQFAKPPAMRINRNKSYTAVMVTSCGTIEMELYAKQTPVTVNSFVFLANRKFFDGTIFHRVIAEFMDQGGDPTGTGTGGPGYQFRDEFRESLKFDEPGLLAMANSGPASNGSQFFITVSEPTHLNGKHTIFGKVTKGYDVALSINGLPTDEQDRPLQTVYIESVRIRVR